MNSDEQLAEWARAATAGDREALAQLLDALQDGIYRLSLRMLGHPQDAEDAAQEVLVVVLTQLGSFRGESALRTWAYRIAANHLGRVRRGRRETVSFEFLEETLEAGMAEPSEELSEAEATVLTREIRLRCTEAMMLSLDRDSRIAYLLSDVFELPGDEAAAILDVDPAIYRKRVSRARARLFAFLRTRCGVYDAGNPCRCRGQLTSAGKRGLLAKDEIVFTPHPVTSSRELDAHAEGMTEILRAAAAVQHPDYRAPEAMRDRVRALLHSGSLKVLRN
jgi:RNA polymerase sigma factor (sigma-70 family)